MPIVQPKGLLQVGPIARFLQQTTHRERARFQPSVGLLNGRDATEIQRCAPPANATRSGSNSISRSVRRVG